MENTKIEISQSLMTMYEKYKNGTECGEYMKLVYIDKLVETPSSDSMRMGARFEYEALGNLDYNGRVPEAFYNLNGTLSKKQTIITVQASNFKEWMLLEGNTKISQGERKYLEFDNYKFSVMRDLVYEDADGHRIICDLKMSGNLGIKESEWGWHKDTLLQSQYKVTQAIFYYLFDVLEGYFPESFVFYVASSRDMQKHEAFKLFISPKTLNEYEKKFHEIAKEIAFENEVTGFTPLNGDRCISCPARNICTKKNAETKKSTYTILNL